MKRIKIRLCEKALDYLNEIGSTSPAGETKNDLIIKIIEWYVGGRKVNGQFLWRYLSILFKEKNSFPSRKLVFVERAINIRFNDIQLIKKVKEVTENKTLAKAVNLCITSHQLSRNSLRQNISKNSNFMEELSNSFALINEIELYHHQGLDLFSSEVLNTANTYFGRSFVQENWEQIDGFLADVLALRDIAENTAEDKLESASKNIADILETLMSINELIS